jgi:hypothetical protein
MAEWQPIETAPANADTVPVILWDALAMMCVVALRHKNGREWYVADTYGFAEDGEITGATHWMPQPLPPL